MADAKSRLLAFCTALATEAAADCSAGRLGIGMYALDRNVARDPLSPAPSLCRKGPQAARLSPSSSPRAAPRGLPLPLPLPGMQPMLIRLLACVTWMERSFPYLSWPTA